MSNIVRRVGLKSKRDFSLAHEVLNGLRLRADLKTKNWFTNYVKGTVWIGCKLPIVRRTVREIVNTQSVTMHFLDPAIELLQYDECDAKLAGMLLLCEHMSSNELATESTLHQLEINVLLQNHIRDWSTADWFAMKVLRKVVFSGNHKLVERVINYTQICDTPKHCHTFVRRCGVVSFLFYERNRDKLPHEFGLKLIDACEYSLKMSPHERFTQTGVAWILRYALAQREENEYAFQMIVRHSSLWTTEAKKSLTKKLSANDKQRKQILNW